MTNFDLMRRNLLGRAGLTAGTEGMGLAGHTLQQLQKSEWSSPFERRMRNRLLMGAMRYGTLDYKRKHPGKWNLVGAIESKIKLWKRTGNDEYLVDIANYCLLEFECGAHPQKHWNALDDHHDHCKEIRTSNQS